MKTSKESKALLEVREWKDKAYREVAHLDLKSALAQRLDDSIKSVRQLKSTGFGKRK